MVREELHDLVERVLDEDPRTALAAYRDFADRQRPWVERRVVPAAAPGPRETPFERLVRQQNEGFERLMRSSEGRPTDDDPVAW